jgi:hypothetical protein
MASRRCGRADNRTGHPANDRAARAPGDRSTRARANQRAAGRALFCGAPHALASNVIEAAAPTIRVRRFFIICLIAKPIPSRVATLRVIKFASELRNIVST